MAVGYTASKDIFMDVMSVQKHNFYHEVEVIFNDYLKACFSRAPDKKWYIGYFTLSILNKLGDLIFLRKYIFFTH